MHPFPPLTSWVRIYALSWLAIKGRVMWLKVWSVGLMSLGIGILVYQYFG
jgi:hypothetical protein